MCHAYNQKWLKSNNERNRTAKPEKSQNTRKEGELRLVEADTFKQANMKEINTKGIPQKNKKT